MTDATVSIALSIGVPTFAVLISTLVNNSRINDLSFRFTDTNARITDLRAHIDVRFDEMRDTWRSELRRVEEVLDARLKHLEERAR